MNISNKLTISRIILVMIALLLASIHGNPKAVLELQTATDPNFPTFFPVVFVSASFALTCHRIAFVIAVIAALTDFLDGYLARKLNQVTDFGKLMDPLADKIFVTTLLLIFVYEDYIPAWIAVVILSREFMVTGLRVLAASKGVLIAADGWGKIKTCLQMIILAVGGMAWVQWLPTNEELRAPFASFDIWLLLWHVSLWVITIITVGSGVSYFVRYHKLYTHDW